MFNQIFTFNQCVCVCVRVCVYVVWVYVLQKKTQSEQKRTQLFSNLFLRYKLNNYPIIFF